MSGDKLPGRDFVTEQFYNSGVWTNKAHASSNHGTREITVLGEKPITGMHRGRSKSTGYGDNLFGIEIGTRRRITDDLTTFTCLLDIRGSDVDIVIYRNCGDAQSAARLNNSKRYLAAIGHEYLEICVCHGHSR